MILFKGFRGLRAVNDGLMKVSLPDNSSGIAASLSFSPNATNHRKKTSQDSPEISSRLSRRTYQSWKSVRLKNFLLPPRQQWRDTCKRNAAVLGFGIGSWNFEEALTQAYSAQIIGWNDVIGNHHFLHAFGAQFR